MDAVTFVAVARAALISHRSMSDRNALLVCQAPLLERRFGLGISLRILVMLQPALARVRMRSVRMIIRHGARE